MNCNFMFLCSIFCTSELSPHLTSVSTDYTAITDLLKYAFKNIFACNCTDFPPH